MEKKPTLAEFHKALYYQFPGISIETVSALYAERYPEEQEQEQEQKSQNTKKKKK